jgi:hypothetical protein
MKHVRACCNRQLTCSTCKYFQSFRESAYYACMKLTCMLSADQHASRVACAVNELSCPQPADARLCRRKEQAELCHMPRWPALRTHASNRLDKMVFLCIDEECLALHMHPRHDLFRFCRLGEPKRGTLQLACEDLLTHSGMRIENQQVYTCHAWVVHNRGRQP